MNGTTQEPARIASLDGLRAFAVGMVIAHHAYSWALPGGFIGVDLFFVLSGFVITRQLLKDGIVFRQFYLHRAARILPPIVPVLIFVAALPLFGIQSGTWFDIAAAAFSFMNWARALGYSDGNFLGHFWSLAVEEQFYFIWPLMLWGLLRLSNKPTPLVAVLVLVAFVWQIGLYFTTESAPRVYNALDTRCAQIALGCLLAMARPAWLGKIWPASIVVFILVCFTVQFDQRPYLTYGIPVVGVAAAGLISASAWSRTPMHWILENEWVQWAGSRSYALYLWHWPLLRTILPIGDEAGVRAFIPVSIAVLFTAIAAELSYRFVEHPAKRWRTSYEARKRLRLIPSLGGG